MAQRAGKKREVEAITENALAPGGAGKAIKKHKPLPESKFGGMTEEEVCKLLLPDHMQPGLDIIFVRLYTCIEVHNVGDQMLPTFSYPFPSPVMYTDWDKPWSLLCVPRPPLLQRQQSLL